MFLSPSQTLQPARKTNIISVHHRRCSVKKMFLKISQSSQENNCARVSFLIKLQAWGCSRMGLGKKALLPKICHTYPTKMKLCTIIPYLKKTPKNIRIAWHTPWVLLTLAPFHRKSANFTISENTDIGRVLVHNSKSFNFFWVFKDFFNKHG